MIFEIFINKQSPVSTVLYSVLTKFRNVVFIHSIHVKICPNVMSNIFTSHYSKNYHCNKNYRHRTNIESSNKTIRSSNPLSLCSQPSRVLHSTNQDKLETWPGYPTKSRLESGYGFRNGIWTEPVHRIAARVSSSFIHRETSFRRGGPTDRESDK